MEWHGWDLGLTMEVGETDLVLETQDLQPPHLRRVKGVIEA